MLPGNLVKAAAVIEDYNFIHSLSEKLTFDVSVMESYMMDSSDYQLQYIRGFEGSHTLNKKKTFLKFYIEQSNELLEKYNKILTNIETLTSFDLYEPLNMNEYYIFGSPIIFYFKNKKYPCMEHVHIKNKQLLTKFKECSKFFPDKQDNEISQKYMGVE